MCLWTCFSTRIPVAGAQVFRRYRGCRLQAISWPGAQGERGGNAGGASESDRTKFTLGRIVEDVPGLRADGVRSSGRGEGGVFRSGVGGGGKVRVKSARRRMPLG